MAWIEFHQALVTHRKLYTLASTLRIRRSQAAGHLAFLWCWALDNAPDGDLSAIADDVINLAADWPKKGSGFVDALTSAGFMCDRRLNDWDQYAGKLLRARAANVQRMRRARANPSDQPVQSDSTVPNQTVPNPTQPNSTSGAGALVRSFDGLNGKPVCTPAILSQFDEYLGRRVWAEGEAERWFEDACGEAAKNGKTNLGYVLAIVTRWEREGRNGTSQPQGVRRTSDRGGVPPRASSKLFEHGV